MRHVNENGAVWYALHEVYYKKRKVSCWGQMPVEISGDSPSDMFGLLADCVRDAFRLRHKILDFETGKPIKDNSSPATCRKSSGVA